MIGSTIEGRPDAPIAAIVTAFVAALCVGLAVQFSITAFAAAGAILAVVALTLFISREGAFSARIEENGLALLHAGEFVRYSEIQAIVPGRSRGAKDPYQYALNLLTPTLTVRVPASLNVQTTELERFLRSHLPPRIVSVPDPDVDEYLNRQMEQFGPQRVHWYSAARRPDVRPRSASRRAWFALFVASLLALIVGIVMLDNEPRPLHIRRDVDQATGVMVVGGAGMVVGLVGLLVGMSTAPSAQPKVKHIELSSLVISPVGIALRQGDLKGELKWEEIRAVKLPRNKPLTVQLAGATVPIFDIYDRPLVEIHARLREFLGLPPE